MIQQQVQESDQQERSRSQIVSQRMQKEKERLKEIQEFFQIKYENNDSIVSFVVGHDTKKQSQDPIRCSLNTFGKYPFFQPTILIQQNPNYIINFVTDEEIEVEKLINCKWSPAFMLSDLIHEVANVILSNSQKKPNTYEEPILVKVLNSFPRANTKRVTLGLVVLFAVTLRILTGLGRYSGYNDPPIFGDYEAHRHWMELTVNLPTTEWYTETENNNITYWRIDYPPISAYKSWVFGQISSLVEPDSMVLMKSRGYETPTHKIFMRWTTLTIDLIFFFSAVIYYVKFILKEDNELLKQITAFLILVCPPFIIVDHGHFQYNSLMHGFTLWAYILCIQKYYLLGSIVFILALNTKIMALYYSIPFFCFILGKYIKFQMRSYAKTQTEQYIKIGFKVLKTGLVCILTMIIVQLPWILENQLGDLYSALFPVNRGLYQLKVANFWCASNIIIKWQNIFGTQFLIMLSIILTLTFCLPSIYSILRRPTKKIFLLGLYNCAQSFFFFSFHVHEKTILLPLVPLSLMARQFEILYTDYVIFAMTTLFAMLREDEQAAQYIVLTLFYLFVTNNLFDSGINYTKFVLYALTITVHIVNPFIAPPNNYPFLYELLYAMIGFIQFSFVFIYSNILIVISNKFKKDTALYKNLNLKVKKTEGKLD